MPVTVEVFYRPDRPDVKKGKVIAMRLNWNASARAHLAEAVEHAQGLLAEDIAEDAKRFAPVETGRLRDSIRAEGNRVVVGVDYWQYPEFGTSEMAAEPYLRPATYRRRTPRRG